MSRKRAPASDPTTMTAHEGKNQLEQISFNSIEDLLAVLGCAFARLAASSAADTSAILGKLEVAMFASIDRN